MTSSQVTSAEGLAWIRFKMTIAASCKMVSRVVATSAEVDDDQALCPRR